MYDINQHIPTWKPRILSVRATISGLDNPCIPFAILKHDPLPPFLRAWSKILEDRCGGDIYDARIAVLYELWQKAFSALNKEQRFFLYAWSASGKSSPRMIEAATLILGIATPGPYYKRWLTTDTLNRRGEIVAWRVEIAMQPEQERVAEIVLSEENMLRLSSSHPST